MTPWVPVVGGLAVTTKRVMGAAPGALVRIDIQAIDPAWWWVRPENEQDFPHWALRTSWDSKTIPVREWALRPATPEEVTKAQLASLEGL